MSTPSTPRPRKRLPVNPSIEHLKKQAKRRVKADSSLSLSDAQHQLAREYGCRNWAELAHVVETMSRGATQRSHVKVEWEPLPAAANRNDLETVRRILEHESFTQHDLDLALARATMRFRERREIAELLIEHGADPNGQYGSNFGPIILAACEALDADGIQFLIRHGAEVDFDPVQTKYGEVTPMSVVLSTYVRGRNEDRHRCFKILGGGFNVIFGARIPSEVKPLVLYLLNGDVGVLSQMIDEYPSLVHERFDGLPYGNIRLRGGTLLHMAVDYGELECIDVLLKKGAQVNALAKVIDGVGGQTPLFHAIASPMPDQNIGALEFLLDKAGKWIDRSIKATFERFGKRQATPITALEFAQNEAQGKQTRELTLLRRLDRPRIDDSQFAAAVDAIDAGDVNGLHHLLREHPDLATARAEESGSYAGPYFVRPALLWFVAENPHRTGRLPSNIVEIAAAIINAGASIADITYTAELVASGDVPRDSGVDTQLLELLASRGADLTGALAAAVQESQIRAIETLLRLGAKPDLAAAAGLGDLDTLRAQLQSVADQNLKQRALYNAALHGQSNAIEVLVHEGGMDVNVRVALEVAALHLAAWNDHPDLVERLLALGADPTIRDGRFNATPAGWARHNGHPQLAERLERAEQERKS